jgi:hypothetical protein
MICTNVRTMAVIGNAGMREQQLRIVIDKAASNSGISFIEPFWAGIDRGLCNEQRGHLCRVPSRRRADDARWQNVGASVPSQ